MTDMIPADKAQDLHRDAASGASPEDVEAAREWADDVLEGRAVAIVPIEETIARALRAYLPPPPRPTLADMAREERAACQWMQADTETWGRAVIIIPNALGRSAKLLARRGDVIREAAERITPRPDLPPLEWPGDQEAAPALPEGWRLADHVTYGRVIVTNSTPDTEGDVYLVAPDHHPTGYDWSRCSPDDLTYLDQGADQ